MSSGVGTRIATGLVLAPAVVLAILFLPATGFTVLVSVLMLAAFWEWTRLSGLPQRPLRAGLLTGLAVLFALIALALPKATLLYLCLTGCAFWLLAILWLRHRDFAASDQPGNRMLKLVAGAVLLLAAWAGALLIRDGVADGRLWLIACLAVIYGGDTFAYFSGRQFGRRKLAPNISPGKTWAGLYGALAGATTVALVAGLLLGLRGTSLALWLTLAVACLLLSILGDLFESLMKRHRQVKDSGRLFPGHGGVLDRGDSLFAALPVFAVGLAWLL